MPAFVGEHAFAYRGRQYKVHSIPYEGLATSFTVDQSAFSAVLIEPASGGPTVTLGSPDPATFRRTVAVGAGGVAFTGELVNIIIAYGKSFSSSKA
jgi:hypothetical protein